jgi:hypothetical protein
VARRQPAGGVHHPPPRKVLDASQDVAHRSGGAGGPGLLGDLAVCDDLAGREAAEGVHHPVFEGRHDRPGYGASCSGALGVGSPGLVAGLWPTARFLGDEEYGSPSARYLAWLGSGSTAWKGGT